MLIVGCGKKGPEIAQVDGVVRISGKPQRGLLVRFLPDPAQGNDSSIFASAKTDDQGHYVLEYSYQSEVGKGAAVGWHRVLVEDATRGPTPQGQQPPPSLVAVAYSSPATTPLTKEVKPGSQTIDLDVTK